jgi:hypothetical protein
MQSDGGGLRGSDRRSGVFAQDWPQWHGPNRWKARRLACTGAWPQQLAPKWKTTVGAGDSTPALVGDKLYVFARQGGDEVLTCLNADDGKEVWKDKYEAQAISGPAAKLHSGPRSSPAVADGKVVTIGVAGVVSCWDTSGKSATAGPVPQGRAQVLHGHVTDYRRWDGHRACRWAGQRRDHRLCTGFR